MRASTIPQSFLRLVQVAVFISVFLVDFTSSAHSTDAFSSAKKSSFSDSVLASPTRYKRAPGWGKRDSFGHAFYGDEDSAQKLMDSSDTLHPSTWQGRYLDISQADKRAPGWGKRSMELDEDNQGMNAKRAPGWGKRAPGWGKRAPGWGKRAPGWGKRAPGWGKRSLDDDACQMLTNIVNENIYRAAQADSMRIAKCEGGETINEPSRK